MLSLCRQTDGQTTVKQYAPDLSMPGHKYAQIQVELSDLIENIVGKEEIAHYEQFLLFPQCFQKPSVVDASK